MAVITVPKALREKLGEEGADSIVELINLANQQVKVDVIELSSEKFERRLTEEITKLRVELKEDNAKLDKRITEEMSKLRTEDIVKLDKRITEEAAKLDNKISETKAEIIRWMFIFWVGQFTAIVGTLTAILFAFFKK